MQRNGAMQGIGLTKNVAGFNLLELMITLSLMSILSAVALPNYNNWTAAQRAEADARTVLRLIQMTRSEAIYSGKQLTFCGTDENQLCVGGQVRYWQVFEDSNANGRIDDGETLFQTAEQSTIALTSVISSRNPQRIIFSSAGSADSFGSAFICHRFGSKPILKRISVNRSGRAYIVSKKKITKHLIEKYC